ncbi:hypothetical protein BJY01DRAFT_263042 [Aspergillus pseudoustus]|uniref:A to I editase domain-containing protein n=1 Tax=Aspergillus pseudoustus TaxID=1810923 RepID=A0ABR4K4J0_9EURO
MGDTEIQSPPLPSRIATLVHSHFDGLPKRSKPVIRDDGTAEWIPMTGIVLVKGENTLVETLTCITVATGAKCLPTSRIPQCKGLVLHDCHAEILAMRAFNHWLLSECYSVLAQTRHSSKDGNDEENKILSPFIRRRQIDIKRGAEPPFEIQPDVRIYMYCTCAPCGDASMELCMAAQDDPTPWAIPAPDEESDNTSGANLDTSTTSTTQLLTGRGHFSRLGIVRRKPARADAESTKSKSCSDKIALRQVSSLLNYETSLFVAPTENAYITALILPEEEITRVGCARCFGEDGRMKGLKGKVWPVQGAGGTGADGRTEIWYRYEFRPFRILSIPTEQLTSLWPFRKPRSSDGEAERQDLEGSQSGPAAPKKSKPSNLSTIWIRAPTMTRPVETEGGPSAVMIADTGAKSLPTLRGSTTGLFEHIMNGVKQGNKVSSPGLRGASALSRAKSWSYCQEILGSISQPPEESVSLIEGDAEARVKACPSVLQASTYREFKAPGNLTETMRARKGAIQNAREILDGWVPNSGDEDWGLDVLVDSKKRKR